jgi:cytochrome c oxidase assembly protein subunit 11
MSGVDIDRANRRLLWKMLMVVALMFGFGFALVPLYDVFCDLTGLNGKVSTEAADGNPYRADLGREVALEFITSVNGAMPLKFRAEKSKMKVHPGEYYTVNFYAENLSDKTLIGQAIPSVAPGLAAPSLKKTECFCFAEQRFEPHQERKMPVRFVVDPGLSSDIIDMTLSYTFFDITDKKQD